MDHIDAVYRRLVAVDNWLFTHHGAAFNAAAIADGVALARAECFRANKGALIVSIHDVGELDPRELAAQVEEHLVPASISTLCVWISGAARGEKDHIDLLRSAAEGALGNE